MFWQLLPCFGNFEQFLPCFGSRGNFWQIRITGKGLAWKQLGTQCSVGVMPRWDEPCDHLMPPPSLPVTLYSGQNHKIRISVWGQSILVNGILYLRLFSHLDITSSKYRNGEFNFVSCSNLSRSLGIMYHMLIHGPKRFWPVPCLIGGFIRGTSTSTFRHKTWWWWWWLWWGGVGTHSTKHSFTGKRKKMSIAAIKRNKFYFIFP